MNYQFIPFDYYSELTVIFFAICFRLLRPLKHSSYSNKFKKFTAFFTRTSLSILMTTFFRKLFIYSVIFQSLTPILMIISIITCIFTWFKLMSSSNTYHKILSYISIVSTLILSIIGPSLYINIKTPEDTTYIVYNQKDLVNSNKMKTLIERIEINEYKPIIHYIITKNIPDDFVITLTDDNIQEKAEIQITFKSLLEISPEIATHVPQRFMKDYVCIPKIKIINKNQEITEIDCSSITKYHKIDRYTTITESKSETIEEILNFAIHHLRNANITNNDTSIYNMQDLVLI